ncbi:MAG: hypothetical protein ACI4TK_17865 [Agathobacter sp.]
MDINEYRLQRADKCVEEYGCNDEQTKSLMYSVFREGFNAGSMFHRLINFPEQEPTGEDWLVVCHDADGYPIAINKRLMLRDFHDWHRFCTNNRVINWQYVEQVL